MVHEDKLAAVLSEFAGTLIADFPIQGVLEHLVQRIVAVLPVTSAGVTLVAKGEAPRYVAASNDEALRFERLQTAVREGPCLLAHTSRTAVAVPDLRTDDRFPRFGPPALAAGLAAVFTFPLRYAAGSLGALDLYRDTPGPLKPQALAAAQTLADVAAAYLLNAQAHHDARKAADRLRRSALHDALTGLPNRVLLEERLQHAASRSRRSHNQAGVLFIDLDHFKRVNDTHGHQVGDWLLRAVAERLSGLTRPGDTLARVSGDEFVFLCEDLNNAVDVQSLATRVVGAFAAPFVLEAAGDLSLTITASVGVAYAGPGEEVSSQLVADADLAMYQAKRTGGGSHRIINVLEAGRTRERRNLRQDLKDAFAANQIDLAYQPIVRPSDGQVTGVEALLRWTDASRGPVPARSIVDAAEQAGLITEIGAWVLQRACTDRLMWLRQRPDTPLDLSVNVATKQLMSPGFSDTVAAALQRANMVPAALILELTREVFILDAERALSVLADLRSLGVRLALADFGTGYSSLSYLRRFPVNIIKIDREFIADIGRERTGTAIVDAITNLAHVLGLSVTAEGVETTRQRNQVIAIGCDNAQGYLYAQPMSERHLSAWLTAQPIGPLHLPSGTRQPAGAR